MAKKKKTPEVEAAPPAPIRYQPITETLEKNYMPYVMSVIISRAIPEIDGFKPSHRKLLYMMYKTGLLSPSAHRVKSASVVGDTLKLNPHGNDAIYETLVRLTRDNASLLHPFIDSKGAFGKQYSSGMKPSAMRYTEVRLEQFCQEIFRGIDKDAVDMVDNYDATMLEPVLLPTTFPNVLVSPNTGIAVGMASNICSFNLAEICDGTIAILKKPNTTTERLMELIKAPDFPGGGALIYDREQMQQIFETGQGAVRVQARWQYDKENNCIEVLQIPYSTTIEQIIDRIVDLVKTGTIKEITDVRDEIGLGGFKLTIDLRRGVDPDKLMTRLYKLTPLEDVFKCNFNILIDAAPRQMGVGEILREWIRFRTGCVRRELTFDLGKKRDKLHLLEALAKILLDIDKAIRIIRKTEKEADVVPALMKGFDIDEIQANYIAEIKLRSLNREYILNRISEMEELRAQIEEIEGILADELKVRQLIAGQLNEIKKKYAQPRRTQILQADDIPVYEEESGAESYPVRLVVTREGYLKKMAINNRVQYNPADHKLKDGDEIINTIEADNADDLVVFTDRAQVYRAAVDDFDVVKTGMMGDFLPSKLGMDDGERPVYVEIRNEYPEDENMVFLFENGKGVRVPLTAYVTKGNRRKLTGACSSASPLVAVFCEKESSPLDLLLVSDADRAILIKSSLIPKMATRTSGGNQLMVLKKDQKLRSATLDDGSRDKGAKSYRKLKLPAAGVLLEEKDIEIQQISIDGDKTNTEN